MIDRNSLVCRYTLVLGLGGFLGSAIPVMAGSRAAAPQASGAAASDPGAATFQRVCSNCHSTDRIVANRRTKVDWEDTLEQMAGKGARATDDEWGQIEDYVLRHYGRVNVNRAPEADLVLILGVPRDQAAAIVSYRQEHGPFAAFDDLAKVTGLDTAKLDAERDAITF
jgi:competence protein ComEA